MIVLLGPRFGSGRLGSAQPTCQGIDGQTERYLKVSDARAGYEYHVYGGLLGLSELSPWLTDQLPLHPRSSS